MPARKKEHIQYGKALALEELGQRIVPVQVSFMGGILTVTADLVFRK